MKKNNRHTTNAITVSILLLLLTSSCSIAFSHETETITVNIPNTYNAYIEAQVKVPEEARDEKIEYSEVVIYYEIEKESFITDLSLYICKDSILDHMKNPDDENIVDLHLGLNDRIVSGEAESELLKEKLHNEYIIIGVENLHAGLPTDQTELTMYISVKGHYNIF